MSVTSAEKDLSGVRIGFVGVGRMGSRMARRLVGAGLVVQAYDLDREAVSAIVADGATPVSSPAEAATDAELVFCSLPGPAAVREAVLGDDGILEQARAGTIVIDMTTSDSGSAKEVATACAERGVRFLDAPVSRGLVGAETGTLAMLVGGDESALDEAMPVLNVIASEVVPVGPTGSGQIAKLCNNMLAGIHAAALGEVLVAGVQAGIGLPELVEAIRRSTGTSFILEHYFPRGLFTDERPTTFALSLMRKDLGLFMATAEGASATLPLSGLVRQLYNAAGASGRDNADFSSVAELYEQLAGVELRLTLTDAQT